MLSGSLDAFSLPDVFALLSMTKKTGVLSIRGQADGRVDFREGEIAYAVSDTRRMALASRLLGGGLVDEEQLRHVVAAQRGGAAALSRVLHDDGLLTPELFDTFVREQIQDAVFELMRLTEGSFAFTAIAEEDGEDAVRVRVPSDQLVAEGARRLDDWSQIKSHVVSFSAVVTLAPRPATESVTVTMSPEQWQLLTFVDGRRTVRDLVDLTGRGEYATCQVIAGLVTESLIEVVDPSVGGRTGVSELVARHELLRRLEERELGAATRGTAARPSRPGAAEPQVASPSRTAADPDRTPPDPGAATVSHAGGPEHASTPGEPAAAQADPSAADRPRADGDRPRADADHPRADADRGPGVPAPVPADAASAEADRLGAVPDRGALHLARDPAAPDRASAQLTAISPDRAGAIADGGEPNGVARRAGEPVETRRHEAAGRSGSNGLRRSESPPRRPDQPGRRDDVTPPEGIPAIGNGGRSVASPVVDDRHEDPPASVFDTPAEPPLGVVVDVEEVVHVAEVTELHPGDHAAANGRQPAPAEGAAAHAEGTDDAPAPVPVVGYQEDGAEREPADGRSKEEEDAFDRAEVERELAALGFRTANRTPDDDAQPGNPFRLARPDDTTRGGLLSRLMDARKQP